MSGGEYEAAGRRGSGGDIAREKSRRETKKGPDGGKREVQRMQAGGCVCVCVQKNRETDSHMNTQWMNYQLQFNIRLLKGPMLRF